MSPVKRALVTESATKVEKTEQPANDEKKDEEEPKIKEEVQLLTKDKNVIDISDEEDIAVVQVLEKSPKKGMSKLMSVKTLPLNKVLDSVDSNTFDEVYLVRVLVIFIFLMS